VASPPYENILVIQGFDLTIAKLHHRIDTHPLRAEVAAAIGAIERADADVSAIDGEIHEVERAIKRLADEVAGIEVKRADIDRKLYDGSVTASKELLALQEEAAGLLGRQRSLEDDELELMEQQEALEQRRSESAERRSEADEERSRASSELGAATAELSDQIAVVTGQRDEAAAGALPDLLATYRELAPRYDGVAVARLVDGHCDGCHMQLSAVARDQLARAPEDAVVTCEECGRLLVR
jgi:predicted  nucleic acid-binding Zn-ribbon protein